MVNTILAQAASLQKVVNRYDLGIYAELTKAKKQFKCRVSGESINAGEHYYAIYFIGSGVQPYPPRIKPEFLEAFFKNRELREQMSTEINNISPISQVLTEDQRDAGFTLKDDDHIVYLNYYGKTIGRYSAAGVTVAQLRHDADQYLESMKNGVSFGKVS